MRRRKSLKRQIANRSQKRNIYIFSEGKNTEPSYFKAVEKYYSLASIDVICERERGAPVTLLVGSGLN